MIVHFALALISIIQLQLMHASSDNAKLNKEVNEKTPLPTLAMTWLTSWYLKSCTWKMSGWGSESWNRVFLFIQLLSTISYLQ